MHRKRSAAMKSSTAPASVVLSTVFADELSRSRLQDEVTFSIVSRKTFTFWIPTVLVVIVTAMMTMMDGAKLDYCVC